jgi:hypothetical protein
VLRLHADGDSGISDRPVADSRPVEDARGTFHFAIVVPDIGIFRTLKESVYIIKPYDWDEDVLIHFLLPRKDKDDPSLVYAFALTELGLVEPKVAGLQYPEQVEFGWSDNRAPIREEE